MNKRRKNRRPWNPGFLWYDYWLDACGRPREHWFRIKDGKEHYYTPKQPMLARRPG